MVVGQNEQFEEQLQGLSLADLRELVMLHAYKLSVTQKQLDALVEIAVKNGLTSFDEVWRLTNERFDAPDHD